MGGHIFIKTINVSGDWNVRGLCCFWHLECWLHCDWTAYLCASLLWSTAHASFVSHSSGLPNVLFIAVVIKLLQMSMKFLLQIMLTSFSRLGLFQCFPWLKFPKYSKLFWAIWMFNFSALFGSGESLFFLSLFHYPPYSTFHFYFRMIILQYLMAYLRTLLIFYGSALRRWDRVILT